MVCLRVCKPAFPFVHRSSVGTALEVESVSGMTRQHILIVDDYPDALDIWALYLGSLGYEISTASDGAQALAQAQRLLPDLIVLDLELPRISGYEVARQLRANPDTQHIPLIAATGYSHGHQLDLARASGFDEIVIKPCDPDALVEIIRRLLHSAQMIPTELSHLVVEHGHNNG
jgi:two-component system, cell cycle response regulator DivK